MAKGVQKKFYDHSYEKHIVHEPEPYYNWILNLLSTNKHERVLDVGSGGGFLLKAATNRGLYSIGIEISQVAAHISKKSGISSGIILADGENLPFREETFNYVTCLGSVEHFPNLEKGIMEMSRVLKPDGKACVVLPNSYFIKDIYMVWRKGAPPNHGQPLEKFATRIEWESLLNRNGLRVLTVHKYNPAWKIESIEHLIYRLFKPLIPLDLSYCFGFVCSKGRMS